ncbi:hypothetical protein DPEC_G00331680 [Dallia pectoralis]|uniref:Uncharacterized protein n=1 Tax=Dallia pectoralis TaxID=75939 RepID=A0ACC2F5V1_DALPE|nr:hypothetical protein DPEC_G00331680 [Dallia pectoralis]
MVGSEESVKYLGVGISPWHGVVQPRIVEKLQGLLGALSQSSLKPSQRATMLRVYAMPRLIYEADHGGGGAECPEGSGWMIRCAVKKWLHLPQRTTNACYIPDSVTEDLD